MVEDLIRAAQENMAARAADPDRVRRALPARISRRARTRRYGGLGVTAAAVAAAAAVAVPVLVLPGAAPPEGTPPGSPPSDALSAPLLFRPGWLPPGLAEWSRIVSPAWEDGDQCVVRTWSAKPASPAEADRVTGEIVKTVAGIQAPFLTLQVCPGGADTSVGTPVAIGGWAGHLIRVRSAVGILWSGAGGLAFDVTEAGLSEQDALRFARSVRPDPSTMALPLSFGWLPPGARLSHAQAIGESAGTWQMTIDGGVGAHPGQAPPLVLFIELTSGAPAGDGDTIMVPPGGESLTVAGHPARYVTQNPAVLTGTPGVTSRYAVQFLVVELGGGLRLTLMEQWYTPPPSDAGMLIRIAENA
ncbi:MAG: hypothetical protein J2P15_12420, partial [Micromonosporaceae bacterium]|nr:hypothetical protein [Micromonosporaceae bacterium]